jgi:hypothetical protein
MIIYIYIYILYYWVDCNMIINTWSNDMEYYLNTDIIICIIIEYDDYIKYDYILNTIYIK